MADIQPTGAPEASESAAPSVDPTTSWKRFKSSIEECKTFKRKLIPLWTSNIDARRGKPFASQSDEDRVAVNLDWAMTKTKQAALFSQTPQVRVDHPPQTLQAPFVSMFEQRLNDTLIVAGVEAAMEEALPDCINAAGFGAVIVAHESITEEVQVPNIDLSLFPPDIAAQIQQTGQMPDGSPVEMVPVTRVLDHRYTINRISPSDLLWSVRHTSSDFDSGPLLGRSGRMTWAEGVNTWKGKLRDEDKQRILSNGTRPAQDRLTHDTDKQDLEEMIEYDEVFYKQYLYDTAAKNYLALQHLVFVNGLDEPVVNEPWKGQQTGPDGQLVGALRYPIRVLTLAYITDETIPPSDSAVGRPQVNEINKSRTQMILQRERSVPVRWFDVNRIDPLIQQSLMRGTWQGWIPVQGQGNNSIGEVSRASMSQESFEFDQIAKADLANIWQIGTNQQGDFEKGRQSASEANIVQSNFNTRVGKERARVGKFFVSIAEVLGGLLVLFEDTASFGEGFDPGISKTLVYSIIADSTVLIDTNAKLEKLKTFLDLTAKSGFLNIEPIMKEIAVLSGLDPNLVVKAPEPKPPVEPNISLRLTGTEDLLNPMALAMLIKSGQAPSPEDIEAAKKLIELGLVNVVPPQPGPAGPGGIAPQSVTPPLPPPAPVGGANPQLALLDKVGKRSDGTEG